MSVIIPTLNEAGNIEKLLTYLKSQLKGVAYELIVADAGSSDNTRDLSTSIGATFLSCDRMCRAYQMNEGARVATGAVLYFVHADTRPPEHFFEEIKSAIKQGFEFGCFRFKFDSNSFLLAINSYFTRFKSIVFRGGDQSLYITKTAFQKLDGFNDKMRIMEEYEFIIRAKKQYKFKIIPKDIIVSARKYDENSYLRVNLANFIVFSLFRWGASQKIMLNAYNRLIKHPKQESLK
ncbi:MAG: TIGR04283 family arsenosugar biosynthesis glycosyltransferase [Vicingaceae bacterium]